MKRVRMSKQQLNRAYQNRMRRAWSGQEIDGIALTREVAGLRYYIAQLERNVTQEDRDYAAGVASLMLTQQEAQP